MWWNTGARGAARDLDVVAPRASAGGSACATLRTAWVAIWGDRVVVRVVQVAAPLMHVSADVEKAEGVGRGLANGFGSGLPAARVIWQRLRGSVSPRKQSAFDSTARGAFPLGFGRKPLRANGGRCQPCAVCNGVVPRDSHDRLLRVIEVGIAPERRRQLSYLAEKQGVFSICHLMRGQTEGVNPDAMNGTLVVLPVSRSHQKPTGWDGHELRFGDLAMHKGIGERSHWQRVERSISLLANF